MKCYSILFAEGVCCLFKLWNGTAHSSHETRVRAGKPRNQNSIPGAIKRFFSSPRRPDQLWNPSSPLQNRHWGPYFGVKRPGHEANHSPPTTAKVKKAWSNTFISLYIFTTRLFIKPRDNFIIFLYLELKFLHKHEIHIQRSCMSTFSIGVRARVQLKTNEFQIYIKWLTGQTFSAASETVRTKVENTGLGWVAEAGQHSTDDPIGRQNIGTVAGSGKFV